MGETRDFAIVGVELEGDAVVGAGAARPTYAARTAPGLEPGDLARQELARATGEEARRRGDPRDGRARDGQPTVSPIRRQRTGKRVSS